MPKNKNKPNAFLYFMLEWKKTEEKRGRTFPNGLKDVQIDPECNEAWRSLSEEEKVYYKTMGKNYKEQTNTKKRTGLGECVSDLERAQLKQQEFRDNMMEYILSLVNNAKERNSIQKIQFYLIHVNYFYHRVIDNNEVEYYPAEISIVECSLEKGIIRSYNEIINEKIRVGFANSAKEHGINTHNIPIDAPFGKSDYQEIFQDICKFLEPGKIGGKYPPLYTLYMKEDVYLPVKSVLNRLAIANNKTDDYLLLYSFEDLFTSIHNAGIDETGAPEIENIVTTIELKKDPFAYKLGLECEYHGDLKAGALHCSQSYVKRWFFVFCSFCCDLFEIQMIAGVHTPDESNIPILNIGLLNTSISSLSLCESKRANSTLSMTGVSRDHRQHVSERTFRDEQRRRLEANARNIEIIDHSKLKNTFKKLQEPIERPLRPPLTKSAVAYLDISDSESIDFSENSFPSIGRGSAIKKKMQENKNSGYDYASRLKS